MSDPPPPIDIVNRLVAAAGKDDVLLHAALELEAAEEIERLRGEIKTLNAEAALNDRAPPTDVQELQNEIERLREMLNAERAPAARLKQPPKPLGGL